MLDQVVSEMRTAQPDRDDPQPTSPSRGPVFCDRARVGQLFSNLLSNALTHGEPGSPVWVRATTDAGFELSVVNLGPPIAPDSLKRLFLPFARGGEQSSSQGLGLGLYIASEIARAHNGSLEAVSTAPKPASHSVCRETNRRRDAIVHGLAGHALDLSEQAQTCTRQHRVDQRHARGGDKHQRIAPVQVARSAVSPPDTNTSCLAALRNASDVIVDEHVCRAGPELAAIVDEFGLHQPARSCCRLPAFRIVKMVQEKARQIS